MNRSLRLQLDRMAYDRWARRGVRTLIRASWVALLVWCVGLALNLFLGFPVSFNMLGALSLLCVAVGAATLLRRRLPAVEVARRLDRHFKLNEQLATALEAKADSSAELMVGRLRENASRTLAGLRKTMAAQQRFPWGELGLLVATALLALGLLAMAGLNPLALRPNPEPLPQLAGPRESAQQPNEPPAGQQGQQPQAGQQPGQGAAMSPENQAAASALADALRDQSVTRPAAEALDQGDTAGAAQSMRELADQAEQLSDSARNDLAQSLRDAADQLESTNPQMADQMRQSAEGLEQGGQQAAQALEDLANATDQLGQQGQGQQGQEGQQQGQQGQDGQGESSDGGQSEGQGSGQGAGSGPPGEQRDTNRNSERLNANGVPIELDGRGEGSTSGQGEAEGQPRAGNGRGGFEQGGQAASSGRVQAGDDPLRIPADLRDVVQDYFSP